MATSFLTLGIRREINSDLKATGITEPTPIQVQAIPVLMAGKDLIAQSQTGTGKTLAFLLPILERIDLNKPYVQALIVTPTRELALQITKEAKKLALKLNINVISIYGGQALELQIGKLKGHPHIIVGTPGRIMDHLRRNTLYLSGVSKLVLDEADQMLHRGFLDDIEEIIRQTADKRQIMLFSATMPAKIRELAARYMRKPADIRVQSQNVTLDEIEQIMIEVPEQAKLDKLCAMIDEYNPYLAIVFCHTKQRATALNDALVQRGYNADELHGDLSQIKRARVLQRFSDAKLQILVATDIAARGLDIEGITHVFNYDIPHDVEYYIHRIGRTGRAGETGVAITFVTPTEDTYLRMIEHGIRASIQKFKVNGQKVITSPRKKELRSEKITVRQAQPKTATAKLEKSPKKKNTHAGTNLRSRRKPKTDDAFQVKFGKIQTDSAENTPPTEGTYKDLRKPAFAKTSGAKRPYGKSRVSTSSKTKRF